MDEKEIQQILSDPLMSTTVKRIAESYMRLHADRNHLVDLAAKYQREHTELYTLFIAMIRQLGGRVMLKKEYMPQFDVSQYKVRWEDCPEEEGIELEVKHFSE